GNEYRVVVFGACHLVSPLTSGTRPPLRRRVSVRAARCSLLPLPTPDGPMIVERFFPAGGPGAAAAVARGGTITRLECVGRADVDSREPIGPGTPFDLASLTQTFTAVAILLSADTRPLRAAPPPAHERSPSGTCCGTPPACPTTWPSAPRMSGQTSPPSGSSTGPVDGQRPRTPADGQGRRPWPGGTWRPGCRWW